MFRIGQKVVRIGDPGPLDSKHPKYDKKDRLSYPGVGEVCRVKSINHWPTVTLITLVEHDNSGLCNVYGWRLEPGFDARNFRPVTDISVFEEILRRESIDDRAPADIGIEQR